MALGQYDDLNYIPDVDESRRTCWHQHVDRQTSSRTAVRPRS